jgi:hypothetical protein
MPMASEKEPLDVLTISPMVVDFISHEMSHSLSFAHEVASLKLSVEGHVERMIDRESLYADLKTAGQRIQ